MITILKYTQLIISGLMIVAILLQAKGDGLNVSTFASNNPIQTKKRGAEKLLFNATIVLAILFVGVSLAFVFA